MKLCCKNCKKYLEGKCFTINPEDDFCEDWEEP